MSASRLSVIIPCYAQAHFVERAVASVLAQDGVPVEVIVVDDGSPDDVPAALAPFAADWRVRVLRQENRGLPAARNAGLAVATGGFVSFLDADDWFAPGRSQRLLALLEADPALGFAYSDIVPVDADGAPLEESYRIADLGRDLTGNLTRSLLQGGYFPPHAVMARTSLVRALGGFDETLGGFADYDLWLRLSLAGHRAAFDPEPGAYYRTHAASMSRDGRHMAEVRDATLRKFTQQAPHEAATGLGYLQDLVADLFAANALLRSNDLPWSIPSAAAAGASRRGGGQHVVSLIKELSSAVPTPAAPDRVAIWDVTLDGESDHALLTQPPVDVVFPLATGVAGWFKTAVTIHPLAWDKPGAGGCEFAVRIDDRVACAVVLDPVHEPADRRWHEVSLRVPPRADGRHEIRLSARSVGGSDEYRWAVWRSPMFVGDAPPRDARTPGSAP